jgi:hypothetical protein
MPKLNPALFEPLKRIEDATTDLAEQYERKLQLPDYGAWAL